jgi:hypothetical protein
MVLLSRQKYFDALYKVQKIDIGVHRSPAFSKKYTQLNNNTKFMVSNSCK